MNDPNALTDFQLQLASLFFSLPASDGFVLAGGAALVANELTERPTQDLDFFRATPDVQAAADALEEAAYELGYHMSRLRDLDTFVRLEIQDENDTVLVDLCLDSPPIRPPVQTAMGLTFAPEELAGRKVVALFSRAEARDFLDVYALLQHFDRATLLELAAEIDAGFDLQVFAEMLRTIDRHTDEQLTAPGMSPSKVKKAMQNWAIDLSG